MTLFRGCIFSVLALLSLSSCATQSMYVPLVDPISITDPAKYTRDIADCGALAKRNDRRGLAASQLIDGAAAGAALGAATGALLGANPGRTAGVGALSGGTTGAAAGAATSQAAYQTIYMNCMAARGWTVLGLTADPQLAVPASDPNRPPEIEVQYMKLPQLGLWERFTAGGGILDVRCTLGDTDCVLGQLRPKTTKEKWLGTHPVTEGVVVTRVARGSAWEKAGIIPGVVIYSIHSDSWNGRGRITTDNQAKWALEMTKSDPFVMLVIKRDGEFSAVKVER